MELYNLNYLKSVSPDNPKFVAEMIKIFLKNVPASLREINTSLDTRDWNNLQLHAHKLRSHIDCLGISMDYGKIAKQIEECAANEEHFDLIPEFLVSLEKMFQQACKELEKELSNNYYDSI